jgi:hypothetical protein
MQNPRGGGLGTSELTRNSWGVWEDEEKCEIQVPPKFQKKALSLYHSTNAKPSTHTRSRIVCVSLSKSEKKPASHAIRICCVRSLQSGCNASTPSLPFIRHTIGAHTACHAQRSQFFLPSRINCLS